METILGAYTGPATLDVDGVEISVQADLSARQEMGDWTDDTGTPLDLAAGPACWGGDLRITPDAGADPVMVPLAEFATLHLPDGGHGPVFVRDFAFDGDAGTMTVIGQGPPPWPTDEPAAALPA